MDDAEIGRIRRRIDWRLLPLLTALYVLAFMDRSNIGNAKVAGMNADLNLTGAQYNMALTVFFFPYSLFEVPSNIVLKLMRPSIWIMILVICWGTVCSLSNPNPTPLKTLTYHFGHCVFSSPPFVSGLSLTCAALLYLGSHPSGHREVLRRSNCYSRNARCDRGRLLPCRYLPPHYMVLPLGGTDTTCPILLGRLVGRRLFRLVSFRDPTYGRHWRIEWLAMDFHP